MERGKLTRVEGASGGQKRSVEYTALTDPNLKVRCMSHQPRNQLVRLVGTHVYTLTWEGDVLITDHLLGLPLSLCVVRWEIVVAHSCDEQGSGTARTIPTCQCNRGLSDPPVAG